MLVLGLFVKFFKQFLRVSIILIIYHYLNDLSSLGFLYLINFYFFEIVILFFSYTMVNFLGTVGFIIINILISFFFLLVFLSFFFKFNLYQMTILLNLGDFFKLSYNSTIQFSFFIDYLSYNFSLLTTLIGFFAYIYSYTYMRYEQNILRFFFFLKSFVLSMVLLLWSGNWVTLIFGWELIGITSFLLINFWVNKITTLKSAFKAFTFNKLSDCFLMLAFLLLHYHGISFLYNINTNHYLLLYKSFNILGCYITYSNLVLFCLVVCSFCKSAQFGFHFWLPDSMEAPVPASALIHSATLVSAGIYILLRFNVFFYYSSLLNILFLVSSFTAFYGALISSLQTDVKKILAYSTISHCGFLMFSVGLFNPYITILYLYGHGFYKSLCFMVVGNLIHFSNNYQDFRKMGNYQYYFIFEYFFFLVSIFNLSSLPFFFNFFSKHVLFNTVITSSLVLNVSNIMLFLAAFCGIFYSSKIFYYSFFSIKKSINSLYNIYNFSDFKVFSSLILRTSKLSVLCISLLYVFNIYVYFNIIFIFLYNIDYLMDINNYIFSSNIVLNTNFYILKILFFTIIYLLLLTYLLYNTKNKHLLLYLVIYYVTLLLLNVF